MTVITLSATVHRLKPPACSPLARQAGTCAAPSGLQRAVLYIGMGLLVVSAAGTNPTSLPFGVDQFDESDERQLREGSRASTTGTAPSPWRPRSWRSPS